MSQIYTLYVHVQKLNTWLKLFKSNKATCYLSLISQNISSLLLYYF